MPNIRRRHVKSSLLTNAGFSLLEVLVAVTLLGGALAALGQLFAIATRANASARAATVSVVLATEKIEQLRQNVSLVSPGGSLQANLANFSDYLDGSGRPLGPGPSSPAGSAFLRRWSVEALTSDPTGSRLLRVRVMRLTGLPRSERAWPGTEPDESRLFTVITQRDR